MSDHYTTKPFKIEIIGSGAHELESHTEFKLGIVSSMASPPWYKDDLGQVFGVKYIDSGRWYVLSGDHDGAMVCIGDAVRLL